MNILIDKPFPFWSATDNEHNPDNIEMTESGWVYHHNDGYDEVIVAISRGLTKQLAALAALGGGGGGGDLTSPNFSFGAPETSPNFSF